MNLELTEEEKDAIYNSLMAVALATLFSITLYSGLETRAEVNQAFDRIEQVQQDLSDGSLDNFTKPEAYLIIESSEQTASLYGPAAAFYLAISAASLIGLTWHMYTFLYLSAKAEENEEEAVDH